MRIRDIYRWEEPTTTLLYLMTFLLLWSLDLLLSGLVSPQILIKHFPMATDWMQLLVGIVLVLHRGNSSPSIEGLRETIQRIEGASRRADSFSEFVEKKGSSNWLEPLLDEVGAWFLVELGDLASFLEIIQKYSLIAIESHALTLIQLLRLAISLLHREISRYISPNPGHHRCDPDTATRQVLHIRNGFPVLRSLSH
jgi:hypothetical protein